MNAKNAVTLLRKAVEDGLVLLPPIHGSDGIDHAAEVKVALAVATGLLPRAASLRELVELSDLGVRKYLRGEITLHDLNAALRSILPNAELM